MSKILLGTTKQEPAKSATRAQAQSNHEEYLKVSDPRIYSKTPLKFHKRVLTGTITAISTSIITTFSIYFIAIAIYFFTNTTEAHSLSRFYGVEGSVLLYIATVILLILLIPTTVLAIFFARTILLESTNKTRLLYLLVSPTTLSPMLYIIISGYVETPGRSSILQTLILFLIAWISIAPAFIISSNLVRWLNNYIQSRQS